MNGSPFFSVLIPTRNRPDLLVKAIDSVLQQSFKDYELLIIDNSSDERTKQLTLEFINKDKRVSHIRTGGLSMHDNWEKAYQGANGENLIILTDRMYFAFRNVLENIADLHEKFPDSIITYNWAIEGSENIVKETFNYETLNPEEILNKFFFGAKQRHEFNYESPKGLNTSLPKKIYQKVLEKYPRLCFPLSPDFGMSFVLLHEKFPVLHIKDPLIISGGMNLSNGNQNRKNKIGIIKFLEENNYSEDMIYKNTPVPIVGLFNSMYNDFFALSKAFNWGYSFKNLNLVEYFLLLRSEIINNEYDADKKSDLEKWNVALEKQSVELQQEIKKRVSPINKSEIKSDLFSKIKMNFKKIFK
jgi:glycosyltransferase involved in cell wall biosynthesis